MGVETTPMTRSTNPHLHNGTIASSEIWPDESWPRKEKFLKVMVKMWTTLNQYLKAVLIADRIYEQLAPVQIDRRAIGRNEAQQGGGSWFCRKCPCSEV